MAMTTTGHIQEQTAGSRWSFQYAVAVFERFMRGEATRPEAERAVAYLNERYMKVGDAMAVLGVKSPTTIKKWIKQGVFPGAHQQGTQWVLPAERVYNLRDASVRAERMNAAGVIEQEVMETDDLFADLGI